MFKNTWPLHYKSLLFKCWNLGNDLLDNQGKILAKQFFCSKLSHTIKYNK